MDLWSKIAGSAAVELTCADPERVIGVLVKKGIRLWEIQCCSALVFSFRLERRDFSSVKEYVEKSGGKLRLLGLDGAYHRIVAWRKRPIVLAAVLLLIGASTWIPNRILFVQVMGNNHVPSQLIAETASQFGLEFGASRRQVRSEALKNELLGAIEELEWVGVNTSGCIATISVRERALSQVSQQEKIGNIVASSDGIVDSISLIRGTVLCGKGQAVKTGQILVSGLSDLGICTRAVQAQAEVYAYTFHEKQAYLPAEVLIRGAERDVYVKIGVQIGKKRINLYSDSGILLPTCGKMTHEYKLCLPGGLELPVSVIVQQYTQYDTQSAVRQEDTARSELMAGTSDYLKQTMVAGKILEEHSGIELVNDSYILSANYECYEMIARQADGIYLEGDTNDDPKDSERGES